MGKLKGFVKGIANSAKQIIPGAISGLITGGIPGALAGGAMGMLGGDENQNSAEAAAQQFNNQMELQKQQQQFNATEAVKTRDFNAQEAQKNRDWQAAQSAKAVQTRAADLKAAGINPVLAAGAAADLGSGAVATGPAATSSAGEAAMAATAPTNKLQMLQTLLSAKQTESNIERQKAETQNIQADTKNKEQQYTLTPDTVKATIDLQNAQSGKARAEKSKVLEETITEKLNQKKIQLENTMSGMDVKKRAAYYESEMKLYVTQLARDLKAAGLENSTIYQAIDHAFSTVGKTFHAGSTTSTSSSSHTSQSSVNIYK